MANEGGSEDRLTNNEFAELIQHLSVQEILTVEYRIGTVWNKLFSRKNSLTHNFFCNLCVLETSSFKNLLAHIDGRRHKLQMERVEQLYHLDYTYPKSYYKRTLTDEKKFEDNKTRNLNLEVNLTSEEQRINVQHKPDHFSTSPADINRSEMGNCDEICENKKIEDNVTPQTKNPKAGIESKPSETTLNVKSALNESIKVYQKDCVKRPLAEIYNDKDVDIKKRKIVVNPAATLSSKKNLSKSNDKLEENNKKHEYQTDKIIIPTSHKNKIHDGKMSPTSIVQTQCNIAPKFALKSYSYKPNDNDVHGILGVEYVIKILKNRSDISPRYECGLCELVLDGFAMQRHLEGYNHRLKFCEKHFPTAIRQYRQYMQNVPEPEMFKVMAPVLAKLAQAIEKHHGRNLPYECYEQDFVFNRHEILAKAFSCRHASEQYGPTFTHVVGSKEIDELINNRHKYLPPSFSRTTIFDTKSGSFKNKSNARHHNLRNADIESNLLDRHRHASRKNVLSEEIPYRSYMSPASHTDIHSQLKSYNHAGNAVQPVDDETYNIRVDDFLKETLKGFSRKSSSRKRSSPDRNLSSEKRESLSTLCQDDVWQAYCQSVDQELYNLDELFKQYRKEPESHPSYNEEWQKFWKRRKDELVSAGLDHRKYNYQPEWVRFVKFRIEELYAQEVENLKIKSRVRFCLPMTNDYIANEKYHVKSTQRSFSSEIIETECNSQEKNTEKDFPMTSQTSQNYTPQVVSVLRLMTALEDSLGSLGPKIIDLLSKALQAEKINPMHVNAKILNNENCSLIETAKEKLKGLIITGLFEGSKKKVLNQVVKDAEELLHYAYQTKNYFSFHDSSFESSEVQIKKKSSFSLDTHSIDVSKTLKNQLMANNKIHSSCSLTDNMLTNINKRELASKLAASLVAQGKTDFDPSQLQQLIAVYKLIENKKRDTGGTLLSNKSALQDFGPTNKKALSDTLSDLLKPSSSAYATSDVRIIAKTSRDATVTSDLTTFSSVAPAAMVNNEPSNSLASVVQNFSGNFFDYTARSMSNAFEVRNMGRNQIEKRNDNGINYINSEQPKQQNLNINNMHSNQFQNNSKTAQNWQRNTNMEAYQSYSMENPNNGFNQTNWQHF